LHEVFAEYFINEFDDPLNAYTGGMANYGGAAASVAFSQDSITMTDANQKPANAGQISLPTGGIRTAFHGAQTTAPAAPVEEAPAPKKVKVEVPAPAPVSVNLVNHVAAAPVGTTEMQGLPHPGMSAAAVPQQQQPASAPSQAVPAAAASGAQVSLPVGQGIRLGGVGGIAPTKVQSTVRVAPGVPVPGQYSMWAPADGGMSEQAVAERRQRNREHAKRSRVRKKFMLESLQEQVRALQRENTRLRMLVQEHIPEHAMKIIDESCAKNPLFAEGTDAVDRTSSVGGKNDKEAPLVRSDFSLMRCLSSGQKCFVLSDPKLPDNPIVFASPDFYKMTGYTSKEVLGRNCRFLQGPGTDKKAVEVIRKAVATGSDATVCLLNYKADGTPFWNQFFIAALRDSDNNIVNYVSESNIGR
jgi:PAS domain S-box-containing protein